MTNKQLLIARAYEFGKMEFDVNETLRLLRGYGWKFLSWGATAFTNIHNKALLFKVNGHHHKGHVVIVLDWNDTYSFRLVNRVGEPIHEEEMVYFDELFDRIDKKIEWIEEYGN